MNSIFKRSIWEFLKLSKDSFLSHRFLRVSLVSPLKTVTFQHLIYYQLVFLTSIFLRFFVTKNPTNDLQIHFVDRSTDGFLHPFFDQIDHSKRRSIGLNFFCLNHRC